MNKKQEELLKKINNGKIKGSQKQLAKILNISQVAISRWLNGTQSPSQENYEKMSKIFKKSEEEIEKIFSSNQNKNSESITQIIDFIKKENDLLRKDIKAIMEDIELIKAKISK
ncbi:MAG: helix-turn-helix transcriptional regulator [Elusimicrobia bacterium]|nr:helix-turn-helix transcriptional regulator [Elusimicrobiota bacterium]